MLRMTGHPFILLSAVLPKSLHKLPSAFILPEEVLRMKGGWKGGDTMFIHYRTPINRAFQRLMKGEREKSLKSQVCFDLLLPSMVSSLLVNQAAKRKALLFGKHCAKDPSGWEVVSILETAASFRNFPFLKYCFYVLIFVGYAVFMYFWTVILLSICYMKEHISLIFTVVFSRTWKNRPVWYLSGL